MQQFLHIEVCGTKKKEIYIQVSCVIYVTRWSLVTCRIYFAVTYLHMQQLLHISIQQNISNKKMIIF